MFNIFANVLRVCECFVANIYTKIINEYETFENTKTVEQNTRKLEYI